MLTLEEVKELYKQAIDEVEKPSDSFQRLCELVYDKGYQAGEQSKRPHGKWEYLVTGLTSLGFDYCSCCNFPTPIYLDKPNFCPNCGADMRGDQNDKTN